MKHILVIGAGAAGMAAALSASGEGNQVTLLDQNEKAGKKIYITGKGRGNLTNRIPMRDFPDHIVSGSRFLYHAFSAFTNEDLIAFMEAHGVKIKTERGERCFPSSDHASDITKAFLSALKERGVRLLLHTRALSIKTGPGAAGETRVRGLLIEGEDGRRVVPADALILSTGGLSYPSTGSRGDGLSMAEELGLSLTKTRPALVPLTCKEEDLREMQGLSLKNVELHISPGKKKKDFTAFGEMMFTHFGITGPIVLTASSRIGKALEEEGSLPAAIDLKPALSKEALDKRILREIGRSGQRSIRSIMETLLPSSMVPVFLGRIGADPGEKAGEITKSTRGKIVECLKAFPLTITGTRGYGEAIITQGGISLKEVDPKTMEAKKVRGLYLAGEVLDIDALTGGFNLQCAFSTGVLAGRSAGDKT